MYGAEATVVHGAVGVDVEVVRDRRVPEKLQCGRLEPRIGGALRRARDDVRMVRVVREPLEERGRPGVRDDRGEACPLGHLDRLHGDSRALAVDVHEPPGTLPAVERDRRTCTSPRRHRSSQTRRPPSEVVEPWDIGLPRRSGDAGDEMDPRRRVREDDRVRQARELVADRRSEAHPRQLVQLLHRRVRIGDREAHVGGRRPVETCMPVTREGTSPAHLPPVRARRLAAPRARHARLRPPTADSAPVTSRPSTTTCSSKSAPDTWITPVPRARPRAGRERCASTRRPPPRHR